MQVVFRSLLAASLVAWVASCALNDHGLGSADAGHSGSAGKPSGATGAAGAIGGTPGAAGTAGTPLGAAGSTSLGGVGGNVSGAAGDSTSGAAGAAASGTAGTTPTGGVGASGTGGAASGVGGVGGIGATAGTSGGAGAVGGAIGSGNAGATGTSPDQGCSDGTREGYLDATMYPTIAACAGAWDTPGLDSIDARTPQCDRRAGNDGDKSDGRGCSVADLCESGWHVCATAHGVFVATMVAGCDDAIAPSGDKPVFFVTRQRATGLVCDTGANPTGTNNIYGCGNIGSTADRNSCAPLTRMLRDSDCQNQFPWVCSDGPIGTAQDEYDVVTKLSSSRGGALCCRD